MLITELFVRENWATANMVQTEETSSKEQFLDQRDRLFKRLEAETDPDNKRIIQQEIKKLEQKYQRPTK
jgi:GMP synthase PP-ATPase subunit